MFYKRRFKIILKQFCNTRGKHFDSNFRNPTYFREGDFGPKFRGLGSYQDSEVNRTLLQVARVVGASEAGWVVLLN